MIEKSLIKSSLNHSMKHSEISMIVDQKADLSYCFSTQSLWISLFFKIPRGGDCKNINLLWVFWPLNHLNWIPAIFMGLGDWRNCSFFFYMHDNFETANGKKSLTWESLVLRGLNYMPQLNISESLVKCEY